MKKMLIALVAVVALSGCGTTTVIREVVVSPSATVTQADPREAQAEAAVQKVWDLTTPDDRASICLLFSNDPSRAKVAFGSGFTSAADAELAWKYLSRLLTRECANI